MFRRAFGWLLCHLGLHAWADSVGERRYTPHENLRSACLRPDCDAISMGVHDRAAVVAHKFAVIEGGRAPSDPDVTAVIDLRVLPAPCEREKAIDAITGYLERM